MLRGAKSREVLEAGDSGPPTGLGISVPRDAWRPVPPPGPQQDIVKNIPACRLQRRRSGLLPLFVVLLRMVMGVTYLVTSEAEPEL